MPRGCAADRAARADQRVVRDRQDRRHQACQAYRRQYGAISFRSMPTNLYGPGDNYHPENSHVLPALIRRFHEAKCRAPRRLSSGAPARRGASSWRRRPRRRLRLPDEALFRRALPQCRLRRGGQHRRLRRLVADVVGFEARSSSIPAIPTARRASCSTVPGWPRWAGNRRRCYATGLQAAYADFLAHRQ